MLLIRSGYFRPTRTSKRKASNGIDDSENLLPKKAKAAGSTAMLAKDALKVSTH